MPHISREDGERFIIPSYRDVLSAQKPGLLKREILLLASNYGEYVNLQKKGHNQYEIAYSSESGYLLGESVWYYFNRPRDLIYCEAIPNSAEAILVIVKSGSVYLDGAFPIDSIPEELVVFQTQQNEFQIYISGDVPISETHEDGKFTFDASSVKAFNYLEKPIFQTLPLIKQFQLQLVDNVLKTQNIGVFPLKPVIISMVILGLLWATYVWFSTHTVELPRALVAVVNPNQIYISRLTSPDPAVQLDQMNRLVMLFSTLPGWYPVSYDYTNGVMTVAVKSMGARTNTLFDWAKRNRVTVDLNPAGFLLTTKLPLRNRQSPRTISQLKSVLANLIDRLSYVLPGNPLKISTYANKGNFTETDLTISFSEVSPTTFGLIADQLRQLPLVLSTVKMTNTNGNLSGNIQLKALGN